MTNEISTIIITHKDRFVRFGFDWFEKFLNKFGVKFIIVNNEIKEDIEVEKSIQNRDKANTKADRKLINLLGYADGFTIHILQKIKNCMSYINKT